jgi:hypothetical protein
MAIPAELLEMVKALEAPLGAALYGVAPYEPMARELQRVGQSLQRNFEAAKVGNRQLVSGIADFRNEVVPEALVPRATDEFTMALRRTVGALSRSLDEFANAQVIAKELETPEVAEAVAGLAELRDVMQGVLEALTPEPEPEPEPVVGDGKDIEER